MLSHVAQKEGLQLPDPLRQRIAQTSERNLRRALLCFETCHMSQYPFKDNQAVQMTDWELYVQVHFWLEESGLYYRYAGVMLNQSYMSAAVEMCVSVFCDYIQHGPDVSQLAATVILELAAPVAFSP